jgi:hypothetical protein
VVLLAAATLALWCFHYDRWTPASWGVPTDYDGDAPEVLAQIQAAAEGDTLPLRPKVIDRLGAPFGAHWNGYPTPDKVLMLLLGGLANVVGLFAAANVGMVLTQAMAAVSFFLVARWLRCRWEWSFAGALLFAFSYHTFHRGLAHFSVAISWTVPLGLLTVALVARSRRVTWRNGGGVLALVTAVALGVSNPYNLLFWLQLMVWALIVQWYGARRRENFVVGVAAVGVAVAAFVAANIEYWIFVQEPDGLPLVTRNYAGTEVYALKPMEMFIPPVFHRWDALAFLGHRYVRWSLWRGEVFLPYLGVAGIAAALGLAAVTVHRFFRRRAVPAAALSIGWLLAYASVGGLTNVVALVSGLQIFRATNRVAVFVSALLLLFAAIRVSRLTASLPAWARLTAAAGVALVGLLDQIPRPPSREDRAEIAARVASDLELGRRLEAELGTGAMVFQLPVMGFPEVAPPGKLSDYELFRPYLTTRTLRFSYGAAKFRSRSRWQRDLEALPAAALVPRLERAGFAALHISLKGYEDRAARLLAELEQMGYTQKLCGSRGHQVVVRLRPAAVPQPPVGRTLTFGRGWHPRPEDGTRWANDDGVISFFNPHPTPLPVEIRLVLLAPDERTITVQHQERDVLRILVGREPTELHLPRFALEPGVNVLHLRPDRGPIRIGSGRYQLRSFGLSHASIVVPGERRAVAEGGQR